MVFWIARRRRRKFLRYFPPISRTPGGEIFISPPFLGTQGGKLIFHFPPIWLKTRAPRKLSPSLEMKTGHGFFQISRLGTPKIVFFTNLKSLSAVCFLSNGWKKSKIFKKVTFLCFWSIFASVVRGICDELKKQKTLHAPVVSRHNSKNPWAYMSEPTSLVRDFMK